MKINDFIHKELAGWGKIERILFPAGVVFIIILSILMNDSKPALVSAVCGISYSILAGKGKISCYFFGLAGTLCYSYIALKNHFYGNLLLYVGYYFPVQIIGIFKWKKHLKKETQEIIKTCLTRKRQIKYLALTVIFTIILYLILILSNDKNPIIDAVTSIFSVAGLYLTVKRCVEQWYIWIIVNALSAIMWIDAYIRGSNCFATILMWVVYFLLSIYFFYTWKKELKKA